MKKIRQQPGQSPQTDELADLLVSEAPALAEAVEGIGEVSPEAEAADRDKAEEDARLIAEDEARKHAEEDEPARLASEAAFDDQDEESDEERMASRVREEFGHDAVVLREGTRLQFNGADVTLPCDLPVVMEGAHDEETLAAVLVRNRGNFDLNKRLLTGEFNPQTGARVVRKTKE